MLAVCGRFASFLFATLFSNSDNNLFAKLAPFSDPRQGPEKKDRDPFSGPCLGSENGANFANKLLSEFEKRVAKRKLANLPQTANISP